jgi:hypothetical protein
MVGKRTVYSLLRELLGIIPAVPGGAQPFTADGHKARDVAAIAGELVKGSSLRETSGAVTTVKRSRRGYR